MECPIVEAFAAEDQALAEEPVAPTPEPEPQDVDVREDRREGGREEEEEKEKKVTKPRRTKGELSIKKERCTVCLREFNPAYKTRHVCKPPPMPREATEPQEEEPLRAKPETQPPESEPTREVNAADVASYLRREKDSRRADKVARYSAAMFGP